ncbi:MAG: hypothetical protein WDO56_15505 [Gammaproteobacteria bacterium]
MKTQFPSPGSKSSTRRDAAALTTGSDALYRDRPTDDGMKGDGADEPNAGAPRLPRQAPSRRAHQPDARLSTKKSIGR